MQSAYAPIAADDELHLQKMQARVAEIKAEQTTLLSGNKFGELPQESQIVWCRLNRELGRVAFQAFELLKKSHDAENAIKYFRIAFYTHHDNAIDDYYAIRIVKMGFVFNLSKMINLLKPYQEMDSESLYVHALTHILELAETSDESLGTELLRKSADLGHVTAQLLFGIYMQNHHKYSSDVPYESRFHYLAAAAYQGDIFAKSLMAIKDYECRAAGSIMRLTHIANEGDALAQEWLAKVYGSETYAEKNETAFQYWSHLASLQGMYDAYVLREKVNSGARPLRCGAEEGFSQAKKYLLRHYGPEKVSIYHRNAFEGNVKALCEAVMSSPGLDNEVRWDIERGIKQNTLQNYTHLLLPILDVLRSSKETSRRCDALCLFAITTLNDQRIQTASHELSLYYFKLILQLMEHINFVYLDDIEDKDRIIYHITDVWYDLSLSRYNIDDCMQKMRKLAGYIETIILNLSIRKLVLHDQHALRQCGVILVSAAYDCQYEACVQNITFDILHTFIALHRLRPSMSYVEMNHKLDVELVRPIIIFTKDQLLDLLTNHITIPKFQSHLHDKWKGSVSRDERTMIDVFDYLQTESAVILKSVQSQPKNLFAHDRISVTDFKMLELLANRDYRNLFHLLKSDISSIELRI